MADNDPSYQPFGMSEDQSVTNGDRAAGDTGIHAGETTSIRPPLPVQIMLLRPDGSTRSFSVSGHFREEHLCTKLDDELCRIENGEKLVVHLYSADEDLVRSLRDRWSEGLSDNRRLRVREILGPTDDPRELQEQIRRIRSRLAQGERIHLALRSPLIARYASELIRDLLLDSQDAETPPLKVSVYGSEENQRAIMEHMGGMLRIQEYDELAAAGHVKPWVGNRSSGKPKWRSEPATERKRKKRQRNPLSSEQAVKDWIKKVEHGRK